MRVKATHTTTFNKLKTKGGIGYYQRGLTLMELIGILAVITILVGTLVPSIVKKITEARRTAETNDLFNIADTLKTEILKRKYIPSATNWAEFVAANMNFSPEQVHKKRRLMVADPLIFIGNSPGKLPYTQTTNGTALPVNPRIILISNLSPNTNNPAIPADIATNPIKFQEVWDTPDRSVPPTWYPAWYRKGENLKIQRLELGSLFCRVSIHITSGSRAWISIDNSPPFSLPTTNRYYLRTTAIGLYDATGTKLLQRDVIFDDTVYVFNGVNWSKDIESAREDPRESLARLVDTFLSTPTNPDSKFGSTQGYLINDLYAFMLMYSRWAAAGFTNYGSSSAQQVPENVMLEMTQQRIDDTSGNLIQ